MAHKRRCRGPEVEPRAGNTLIVVALVLITAALFAPLYQADFVNLDDPVMVPLNPWVTGGLSVANAIWALGFRVNFWMPAVWLSFMTEVSLHGVNAGWFHVVNIALHALSTTVLFGLLFSATRRRWPSAAVALLFAVHPLHVESVAWITERKDVLSTLFWWLTLWSYVGWVRCPSALRYALTLVLFACGLMAKPMLVTLPITLLLLDLWPLGRVRGSQISWRVWWPLIREKWPFAILALAAAAIAPLAQQRALSSDAAFPWALRIANATVSAGGYLVKTVWPTHLAVFYPYRHVLSPVLVGIAAAGLIALTVGAWWTRNLAPYLLVGWLWYVMTLLPVCGLIQIGTQRMADRYTYVPLVGVFIAVAWSVASLATTHAKKYLVVAASVAAFLGLAATTKAQVDHWMTSTTLWQASLEADPDNYFAEDNIGALLTEQGRFEEALTHLQRAAALDQNYWKTFFDLGVLFMKQGSLDDARIAFEAAVVRNGRDAGARRNLGIVRFVTGDNDAAIRDFRAALQLNPDVADAHMTLGVALARKGEALQAIAEYREAIRLQPSLALAHYWLGMSRLAEHDFSEATEEFQASLRLDPNLAEARAALASFSKKRD